MAHVYRQPTQSDLEREKFLLGLASAQSKAHQQAQAEAAASASEIDYATAPDRVSLSELNQMGKSAQSAARPKSPLLDAWKTAQTHAQSAGGTDYTAAPDRISLPQLNQISQSSASDAPKSNAPILDAYRVRQASKKHAGQI